MRCTSLHFTYFLSYNCVVSVSAVYGQREHVLKSFSEIMTDISPITLRPMYYKVAIFQQAAENDRLYAPQGFNIALKFNLQNGLIEIDNR